VDKEQREKLVSGLGQAMDLLRRTKFNFDEQSGITKSEKFTLMLINDLDNKQLSTISEISKKIGVTLAAVTHHINSLEENGYVERSVSADDRRVSYIKLTEKGKMIVDKLRETHRKKISEMIEYLGDNDSQKLISLITKIANYKNKEVN